MLYMIYTGLSVQQLIGLVNNTELAWWFELEHWNYFLHCHKKNTFFKKKWKVSLIFKHIQVCSKGVMTV